MSLLLVFFVNVLLWLLFFFFSVVFSLILGNKCENTNSVFVKQMIWTMPIKI